MRNNTEKSLESLDYHALTEAIHELEARAQHMADAPARFQYCLTEEQLFSIESRFGRERMVEAWNQLPDATIVTALDLCDESLGDAGASLLLPEKLSDLLAEYKKYDGQFRLAHIIRCGFMDDHGRIQEDRAIEAVLAIFQNEASREALLEILSQNPYTETVDDFTKSMDTISQENDFSFLGNDLLLMALLYTVQDAEIGVFEWLTDHLFDPLTGERVRRLSTEIAHHYDSMEEDFDQEDPDEDDPDEEEEEDGGEDDDDDWR